MLSERTPSPISASAAAGSAAISPQTESSTPAADAASTASLIKRSSAGWSGSRYRPSSMRELGDEIGGIVDRGRLAAAGQTEKPFGRCCLKHEREQRFADVVLGAADHQTDAGDPLQVKVMLIEPPFGPVHIPSHSRAGRIEILLEIV